MPKLSLMVADDHPVVREGLRALLETQPDFTVVGEAGIGPEVPDLVEQLRPDVLLLDLLLPSVTGLEVLRRVRRHTPTTHVLILSTCTNESCVLEALRAGATGYCLRSDAADELMAGLRVVAAGKRYVSPPTTHQLLEAYVQQRGSATDLYATLTNREREVLHLVAEGHTNIDIGIALGISSRTVESHRANLMRKLNLRSNVDLARYAIQRGIISPV